MLLSRFEETVLAAIIERDPEQSVLHDQLRTATVENREYTGVGLFTNLVVDPSSPRLERSNRYIQETPKVHLVHPALRAGAEAKLWLSEGRIDTLECYTYDGPWPEAETEFSVSR